MAGLHPSIHSTVTNPSALEAGSSASADSSSLFSLHFLDPTIENLPRYIYRQTTPSRRKILDNCVTPYRSLVFPFKTLRHIISMLETETGRDR
jgi:hypothetical protein